MNKLFLCIPMAFALVSSLQAMQEQPKQESKAQAESADLNANIQGFRAKSVKSKAQQGIQDDKTLSEQVKLAETLQEVESGKGLENVQAGLWGIGYGNQSPQEIIKTSLQYQSKDVTQANRSDFEAIIDQLQLLQAMNNTNEIQRFCKQHIPVLQAKLDAAKKS